MALRTPDGLEEPATALRGQWLLVVVGSSACDERCEQRLYTQRQLLEMLGRERDRVDRLWLVRDDGPIATALLQGVQAATRAVIARAEADQVQAWLAPEAGRRIHEHLYVVDPMGEWMMRVPGGGRSGQGPARFGAAAARLGVVGPGRALTRKSNADVERR